MPTIEERALALLNEATDSNLDSIEDFSRGGILKALFNSLEDHDATLAEFEAFRRGVSDAVEAWNVRWVGAGESYEQFVLLLSRFILPKPVDPLVEVVNEAWGWRNPHEDVTENLRAALAKRGLKLVEVGDA